MSTRSGLCWLPPLTACIVIALALSGCDGGGSNLPPVVTMTFEGMPTSALVPGQAVHLNVLARFADGTVRDVTAEAQWTTSAQEVAAVHSGRVTAKAPGRFDVGASFEGATASLAMEVAAPAAAFFMDSLQYAFEYELDGQGRVKSYRVSPRPGIDYGSGLPRELACGGGLYTTYGCMRDLGEMRGQAGRLVSAGSGLANIGSMGARPVYAYGPNGLQRITFAWSGPGNHDAGDATVDLGYDTAGRLATVTEQQNHYTLGGATRVTLTARVTADAAGRMATAAVACEVAGLAGGCTNPSSLVSLLPYPTRWTYDANGFVARAGSTTYMADADGWLVSRTVDSGATDSYAIVRAGRRVVEESFTRAEPWRFYGGSTGVKRVRYDWSRLPVEPLFVPRALAGRDGGDFFGVISSHHR